MIHKRRIVAALALGLLLSVLSAAAALRETGSPAIEEKKIEDITRTVSPSVVRVEATDGMRKVATGVVIDRDGSVVTTALISPRDEEINIITADGKKVKAEFKGFDTQTQIALIQAKDKSLVPIALGKSDDLQPGAWIGVVSRSPENKPAVTQGIVSSVAEELRLNVWVMPGSSGSPVVDGNGRMVGLLRGVFTDEQPLLFEFRERQAVGSGYVFSRAEAPSSGLAMAIPMEIVRSVESDLKTKGKVERGWLGVSVAERDNRVEIAEVEAKSPAELAKLKEGDVILAIEGKGITSGGALSWEIRSRKPGQDVTIKIERDGKPIDVKVKLGEFTEEEAKRELSARFPRLFPAPPERPGQLAPRAFPPKSAGPEKGPEMPGLRRFALEKRKFIGVSLQELNKEMAEYFGVKEGTGLLVGQFSENSPAQKAGLKIGDVILRADGKRVETVAELSELIQDKKKGDKIKLEIIRDKKPMSLDVEIAEEDSGFEAMLRSFEEYQQDFQDQMRNSVELQKSLGTDKLHDEGLKQFSEEMQKLPKGLSEPNQNLTKIFKSFQNWRRV